MSVSGFSYQGLQAITTSAGPVTVMVFTMSDASWTSLSLCLGTPPLAMTYASGTASGGMTLHAATFAATVPAGPDIVALAVAPPVRVTAAHVAALPGLRIVAAASAGYDHIDVAAVTAAGACVTHTPGYCDVEVADHAIAMTAALLRRLPAADAMVRGGVWSSRAVGARRITGSALGVVGLGRIGVLVARRAAALAEPPPADHVAFGLPNTIITPHLAWLSPESEFASYELAARAIADVLAGRPPQHPVRS